MNRDEREVDDRNATAMNQGEVEVEGRNSTAMLISPQLCKGNCTSTPSGYQATDGR